MSHKTKWISIQKWDDRSACVCVNHVPGVLCFQANCRRWQRRRLKVRFTPWWSLVANCWPASTAPWVSSHHAVQCKGLPVRRWRLCLDRCVCTSGRQRRSWGPSAITIITSWPCIWRLKGTSSWWGTWCAPCCCWPTNPWRAASKRWRLPLCILGFMTRF